MKQKPGIDFNEVKGQFDISASESSILFSEGELLSQDLHTRKSSQVKKIRGISKS